MKNKQAFTLVELIVVITILAILGTIAFLSFNGYASSARDSARLTDLDNLTKALEMTVAKTATLPKPASSIDIKAGTTTIGYQGYADKTVLGMISMSDAKDPLDSIYYTYSVNASQNKYQILGFLESSDSITYNSSPFIDSVYAEPASYSGRTVFTRGGSIGILLSSGTLLPAQTAQQNIDTAGTSTGYITYFETKDSTASLTGNLLFSNIYNRRKDLLTDKTLAASDPTLVGYWDMETMSGGRLWDWSNYGNSGTLNGGVVVGGVKEKNGKATSFDGIDDWIDIGKIFSGTIANYSIIAKVNYKKITARDPAACVGDQNKFASILTSWNNYHGWTTERGFRFGVNSNCNGNSEWEFYSQSNSPQYNLLSFDSLSHSQFNIKYANTYLIVGGVLNNGVNKLYINGSTVKTLNGSGGLYDGETNTYIGRSIINNGFIEGDIDEIRIYNRALSDSEIVTLYNTNK